MAGSCCSPGAVATLIPAIPTARWYSVCHRRPWSRPRPDQPETHDVSLARARTGAAGRRLSRFIWQVNTVIFAAQAVAAIIPTTAAVAATSGIVVLRPALNIAVERPSASVETSDAMVPHRGGRPWSRREGDTRLATETAGPHSEATRRLREPYARSLAPETLRQKPYASS